MYSKKKSQNLNRALIIVLAVTTVASISWYISRPQAQAEAIANSQILVVSQESQVSTSSVDVLASSFPLLQTVDDITVDIVSTQIIKTGLEIGVCYPTPDSGDWYPTPGSIYYSTYEVIPDEFEFISEQKADGKNEGRRCAVIRYRIDEPQKIEMPIKFSLLGFWAVPREASPCENFQQRFDTNLNAKKYDLKVKCSDNGQNGISVTLVDNDKSITSDKAQEILDEIVRGEFTGPWSFDITEFSK
jgi:hypothetical protein